MLFRFIPLDFKYASSNDQMVTMTTKSRVHILAGSCHSFPQCRTHILRLIQYLKINLRTAHVAIYGKKKLFPHPSGSLATCPPQRFCPMFHVASSTWTPPIKSTLPAPCLWHRFHLVLSASPSSVIVRATGHRGKEPEFCSCLSGSRV